MTDDEWIVYEGKILTDSGIETDVELSLMQAAVGVESYFKLHKSLTAKNGVYGSVSEGKYSVSYGLPQQGQGITLIDRPKKIVQAPLDNSGMQDVLETPELYFKTVANEKLIQTDRGFNSKHSKYVLHKRSDLFTVEGYVTCQDSVTEFFERNTMKKWNVASLGEIDSIKIKYRKIATENYEGVYLKALAYSVVDTSSQSNRSLVVKRLIRMEKSDARNPIK